MESDTLKQLSLKVSQYFLEFLESDFKRQQAPRRRIVLQTETGLKSGMSLSPYQSLQAAIWQQLAKPWESTSISVTPKTYQRPLSHGLKAIVREQVSALTDESRQTVIDSVIDRAKRTLNSSVSHPEEWITTVREELADALGSNIVRPMLALLDAAIKDQAYSAVDSVYTAEADLILTLAEPLDAALTEVLARYSTSRQSTELETIANDLLSLEYVRSTLQHFFESFSAADAYLEFRDLETYVTTADNIQLYLYVGTIQYSSTTYPLFYIPLDILRSENGHTYTLTPSNHIYANKRAVDFILQELGERAKRQWLSPIKDRITYIPAERSATETIEPLLTDILRSLDFTDDLRIPARQVQKLSHFNVSVTNQLYFCAFDKSDEALLNDYEEMISQIHKDEAGVVNLFQSLISGVITSNPESIAPTIDKLWDETSISSRLVVDTPIPLNEEQQKVLKAIQHEDGKIIVVEGPPGTGKSHTIVAIAADCAFRKKSCLILSDKKEALEVVHDKLSSAMNAVRNADQFPNPLLRLGTEQANFRKLTSASSLAQVATQAKAAKNNLERLQKERDSRRDELQNLIQTSAQVLGSVSVSEICETEKLKGALETEFGIEFVSAL